MEDLVLMGSGALAAVVATGVWWLGRGRRLSEEGRRLRRHRRATIRDAPEGEDAKIVGRLALLGEPLSAPISGRACACWEVVVDERPDGDPAAPWTPLIRRHDVQAFEVEDETGTARVVPRVWGVEVVRDFKQRAGLLLDAPAPLTSFLEENGIDPAGRILRFREGVLESGERVAVLGPCHREPVHDDAGASTYRETRTRLVVGSEVSGVTVSDDPRVMR